MIQPDPARPEALGTARLRGLAEERLGFRSTLVAAAGGAIALLGPTFAISDWNEQSTWHNAALLTLFPLGIIGMVAARAQRIRLALFLLVVGGLPVAGGVHMSGHRADLSLLYLLPVLVIGIIAGDTVAAAAVPMALVVAAGVFRIARWQVGVDDDWSLWVTHSFDGLMVLAITAGLLWIGRRRMARDEVVLQEVLLDRQRLAERARAASDEKSAFLARVSHELRTPLNAILGYTELIEEEEELSPDAAEDLGRVHRAATSLLALVDDVLDLSKVEAGRWEWSLGEVTLSELLEPVSDTTAPLVARNGNRLEVSWVGEGEVTMDAARVRQVLLNLLSNAARFTHDGVVSLRATRDGGTITFEVEDTGIGIPADRLSSLFEPFVQVSPQTAATYGGTGLGLTICDRFVRQMGGHMEVQSELGKGSLFRVVLPVVSTPS